MAGISIGHLARLVISNCMNGCIDNICFHVHLISVFHIFLDLLSCFLSFPNQWEFYLYLPLPAMIVVLYKPIIKLMKDTLLIQNYYGIRAAYSGHASFHYG